MANQVNIVEDIKCDDCKRYLSFSPVFAKKNGGSICSNCKEQSKSVAYRNGTYEALAKYSKFPCQFNKTGCETILAWEEAKLHEADCEYRNDFNCFMNDCRWTGSLLALKGHYQSEHPTFFLNLPTVCQPDITTNSDKKYLCFSFNNWFIVHVRYTVSSSVLSYYACFVGKTDYASECKYNVEITSMNGNMNFQKIVQPISELYNPQNHNVIELNLNSLLSLGVISTYRDCKFTLSVKLIQDSCTKCKSELTTLNLSKTGLVCDQCYLIRERCRLCNKEILKKDYIHRTWFCETNFVCFVCDKYISTIKFEHDLLHIPNENRFAKNVITLKSVEPDRDKKIVCTYFNAVFIIEINFITSSNTFHCNIISDVDHNYLNRIAIKYTLSNLQSGYETQKMPVHLSAGGYDWEATHKNDFVNPIVWTSLSETNQIIRRYNLVIEINTI